MCVCVCTRMELQVSQAQQHSQRRTPPGSTRPAVKVTKAQRCFAFLLPPDLCSDILPTVQCGLSSSRLDKEHIFNRRKWRLSDCTALSRDDHCRSTIVHQTEEVAKNSGSSWQTKKEVVARFRTILPPWRALEPGHPPMLSPDRLQHSCCAPSTPCDPLKHSR